MKSTSGKIVAGVVAGGVAVGSMTAEVDKAKQMKDVNSLGKGVSFVVSVSTNTASIADTIVAINTILGATKEVTPPAQQTTGESIAWDPTAADSTKWPVES